VALHAGAADGRTFVVAAPDDRYPGARFALETEKADLVLAVHARPIGRGPVLAVADAPPVLRFLRPTWIDVVTVAPAPREAPPGLVVEIRPADGAPRAAAPIEDAELARMAPKRSSGGGRRREGAPLAALIAARVPLDQVAEVVLEAGDGTSHVVAAAALAAADQSVTVRRNQRGMLKVQHTAAGQSVAELRGLARVTITLRPGARLPATAP
jgi:hypothetical protein